MFFTFGITFMTFEDFLSVVTGHMYWNIQIKIITTTIIIITIIIIIFVFWSQCCKLSYYAMIIEWMQKLSKTTKFSIHCNKKIWVRALSLSLYPYLLPFFALNSTNSILNFFIYHGVLTTATACVYREWGITLWFPGVMQLMPHLSLITIYGKLWLFAGGPIMCRSPWVSARHMEAPPCATSLLGS